MLARPTPTARVALLLSCTLPFAGCAGEEAGDDTTASVVVGLSTDMAVGFDIRRLDMTTKVDGAEVETRSLSYEAGALSLPDELVIEAHDGADVELTLSAYPNGDTEPVVTRTAKTRAARGRTLFLPVSLDEACSEVPCSAGATCVDGACVDPFTPPSALDDHDPEWLASAPDACKTPSSGPPELAIGKGQTAFAPLEAGEVVGIEPGAQGGHHVWLALRVTGLRQQGSHLTLAGSFPDLDVDVPPSTFVVTLRKSDDGGCEMYAIRFQVDHAAPVDTVKGQPLDIDITLRDTNGDVATATKQVVIAP